MNLEFDISFPYYFSYIPLLFLEFLSIQICTYNRNDSIEFMRLEELMEPSVKRIPEEEGYEW